MDKLFKHNASSSYESQYKRLLERALTDDAVYRNDRTGI
jgi:hypothetical protein